MISVEKKNPVVSIVVVTYNSSSTVIETLESIKTQTYQDIELIVSDDCSTDDTVKICREWLDKNGTRFVHAELVTTEKNTGVSGNFNRGIRKSHGEWIKSIAGDDLLIATAIEEYVNFITGHPGEVRMCVCDVEPFVVDGEVPQSLREAYERLFMMEAEPYEQQRRRVMTALVFVGPAYFYSRELFDEMGGFSVQYGNAEEWPFVYKVIMGGNQIYAINRKLVRYRVQAGSLGLGKTGKELANKGVFMGMYHHYFDHAVKDLIGDGRPLAAWHYALSYWGRRMQYQVGNPKLRSMVLYAFMALSPLAYLYQLRGEK